MSAVSVIIVNYRTPDLTVEAAKSAVLDPLVSEVLIVNSFAEGDGSLEVLSAYAEQENKVTVVPLQDNPGFGGANNRGAERATGEYLFFLNSDATLEPGTLKLLTELMSADHEIGMAAPPVYLPETHTLQPDVCGSFPSPLAILTRKTTIPCNSERPDWISGVAFMVRRDEFMGIQGFDEHIFMYYEDIELSHRYRTELSKLCARISLGPGVVHLGGASSTSSRVQKASYYRSQDYYLQKAGYTWISRIAVKLVRSVYVLWKH